MSLTVIDVGQGQALLVEAPGGRRYLVDGGGTKSNTFDIGRAVVGPVLTEGRAPELDGMFMTHGDWDHAKGLLHELKYFSVPVLYTNGHLPSGDLGKAFRDAMDRNGVRHKGLRSGDDVELGGGLVAEIVHPDMKYTSKSRNESSLAIRLVWRGEPLALLLGDVERQGLRAMLSSGKELAAPVMILPHHGSRSSLSKTLYNAVKPRLALCSAGYLNQYNQPSHKVVEALVELGTPVISTSRAGQLRLTWDAPDQWPALSGGWGGIPSWISEMGDADVGN